MRRLFTILFTATLFVSQSFGQMVVKGDVVNTGEITSDAPVFIKADANPAGVSGRISNSGTLNLKHGITYASTDVSDGLLFNDYANSAKVDFTGTNPADVKVAKTFQKGKWYLISFPFDVLVGDITEEGGHSDYHPGYDKKTWIYTYNTEKRAKQGMTDDVWEEIGTSDALYNTYTLTAGIGYQLYIDDEDASVNYITLLFPAKDAATLAGIYPTGGTKELPLVFHKDETGKKGKSNWGWNMLGIHRTSTYHMHQDHFTIDGIADDVDADGLAFIYVKNADDTWSSQLIDDDVDLFHISPYSAYFIQIGGEAPEAIAHKQQGKLSAVHHGLTYEAIGARSSKSPVNLLDLKLEGSEGSSDQLIIRQSDRYSNNYVLGEDAPKMFNQSIPDFYSFVEDIPMSINQISAKDNDLNLGVNLKEADSYTIGISRLKGFDDTDIYLKDKLLGVNHNLLDGDYSFQIDKGTTDDRFALHFGSVTAIQTPNSQISVFVENNVAYVKNIKVGDTVSIYNIGGQLISQGVASSSKQSYRLAGQGVYVIKVSGSESFISKVINK